MSRSHMKKHANVTRQHQGSSVNNVQLLKRFSINIYLYVCIYLTIYLFINSKSSRKTCTASYKKHYHIHSLKSRNPFSLGDWFRNDIMRSRPDVLETTHSNRRFLFGPTFCCTSSMRDTPCSGRTQTWCG